MRSLDHFAVAFGRVGWFVPPFIQMGVLSGVCSRINSNPSYSQLDLEQDLSIMYESIGLASMVLDRYPKVSPISDYKYIISEAVEAHFSGLDRIAVAGLLPVVEGAARRIAEERGIRTKATTYAKIFSRLCDECKEECARHKIGDWEEVASMMDSFANFTNKYLFAKSHEYSLSDNTNRNGILHGSFSDSDYGSKLNFYKVIATIDFLVFVCGIRGKTSWLAPDTTDAAIRLSMYYNDLVGLAKNRRLLLDGI